MEKSILEVIKKDFEFEYLSAKLDDRKYPELDLKSTASTYLMALSIIRFWEENHKAVDLEGYIVAIEKSISTAKEELEGLK